MDHDLVDPIEEIIGKNELIMDKLRGCGKIHSFPAEAFTQVEESRAYVRKGRKATPLEVCYPPHIIVDSPRRFAIFSDEFILVPPRQIGIAGKASQTDMLKALCLYLKSDFVAYHQYLSSALWGIERDRLNVDDLNRLPIPLGNLSTDELSEWVRLYNDLVETSSNIRQDSAGPLFDDSQEDDNVKLLLNQVNKAVYDLLGITKSEQYLIHDLLQTRMQLNEGAIAREAVKLSSKSEITTYAAIMKSELDGFLNQADSHLIKVYYSDDSAIIKILHVSTPRAGPPEVIKVDAQTQAEFAKLARQLPREQGQWIYFNRGLRFFEGRTTYIFKPRERLCWLKSQALVDADEFIADKLTAL